MTRGILDGKGATRAIAKKDSKGKARATYGRLVGKVYDYFFGPRFHRRRGKILRTLEHFARSRGGQSHFDTDSTVFPKTTFGDERFEARLVVSPTLRSLDQFDVSLTVFSHRIKQPNYFPVLECYSTNLMKNLFRAPWMEQAPSGDSAFDHRFHVRILAPLRVRTFLTGRERDAVFRLLYLYGRNNLYVSTGFNKLLVRKTMEAADMVDLGWADNLWEQAIFLFRRLEQKIVEAVLGEDEMRFIAFDHAGIARCKVCGEAILFDEVRCDQCETPHHHDCWTYSEGCSVYGCGSKSYAVRGESAKAMKKVR